MVNGNTWYLHVTWYLVPFREQSCYGITMCSISCACGHPYFFMWYKACAATITSIRVAAVVHVLPTLPVVPEKEEKSNCITRLVFMQSEHRNKNSKYYQCNLGCSFIWFCHFSTLSCSVFSIWYLFVKLRDFNPSLWHYFDSVCSHCCITQSRAWNLTCFMMNLLIWCKIMVNSSYVPISEPQ